MKQVSVVRKSNTAIATWKSMSELATSSPLFALSMASTHKRSLQPFVKVGGVIDHTGRLFVFTATRPMPVNQLNRPAQ